MSDDMPEKGHAIKFLVSTCLAFGVVIECSAMPALSPEVSFHFYLASYLTHPCFKTHFPMTLFHLSRSRGPAASSTWHSTLVA